VQPPKSGTSERESGYEVKMGRIGNVKVPADLEWFFSTGPGSDHTSAANAEWASAEWARLALGEAELAAEYQAEQESLLAEKRELAFRQKSRRERLVKKWEGVFKRNDDRKALLDVLRKVLGRTKE
jgi:hypothetical protein